MTEQAATAPASAFQIGKKPDGAPSPSAPAGKPVNTLDPTKSPQTKGAIKVAPFKVEPIQERDRWFKALFYGNHGTGKTELAGTAVDVEHMRDVLLIDGEKGQRTLQESPRIHNKELIDRIEISSFAQAASIYDMLKAHCNFRDADDIPKLKALQQLIFQVPVGENDRIRKWKTIIVDSTTELDLYSMQEVMKQEDIAKVLSGEMDVADWPAFRKNNEKVKLLLRSLRDLPLNVLFIAQRRWSQDERKQYHYNPGMTGQLSGQLQSYVDMVGYLRVEDATPDNPMPRRLYVQPITGTMAGRFDAKNRRASFSGAWFDLPTMSLIMTGIGLSKTPQVDAETVTDPEAA